MTVRIAIAAIFASAFLATSIASAQNLRFGAGQQGSQNYGVNAALAQAINASTDFTVTVQAFGGPTAYIPLVNGGELDIAALVTPDLGDAIRGMGPFEGSPQEGLRVVAPLLPSPVGLMVRADSGIESIADLRGRRVAWSIPAQASLMPYVEGALANGGLTRDDVRQVPVASVGRGVDAVVSGSADATLFALRGGAVVEADAATGGIRWLPFDSSPEAVERMTQIAPEAYIIEMDGANLIGTDGPLTTMAYDYVLVANADLEDEVVAEIATLLRDRTDEIAASNEMLATLSADTVTRAYGELPFHPAAEAVLHAE